MDSVPRCFTSGPLRSGDPGSNVRPEMRIGIVVAILLPALVAACLPPQLGGRPPSLDAFLSRNGLQFVEREALSDHRTAAAARAAQREGPNPGAPVNPPVYGMLSCPVACQNVLSDRGDLREFWFVSYPGTEYGGGDIEWVLVDGFGVSVISTRENP